MKKRDPHLRELVALSLIPNIGARRIKSLLGAVDHPRDLFHMKKAELESVYGIGPESADMILRFNRWEEADRVIAKSEEQNLDIVTLADPLYPGLLKEIYDPPALLWVKGSADVLNTDSVAVVGTRRCSDYGKEMAEFFVKELVASGITIVSGLAYGIDAVAHETALRERGRTIAVLGSGMDNIYPSRHIRLAYRMAEEGGAVISEYPPETIPEPGNFPVRNRIVSGITLGTLVIESGRKGGSMITASSALDQNREVFAVPHRITDRSGAGCNHLIGSGQAKLVETSDDILSEIAAHLTPGNSPSPPPIESRWKQMKLDKLSVSVCELLETSPLHIDALSSALDVPGHKVLAALLDLEMKGCVRQNPGKVFGLRKL